MREGGAEEERERKERESKERGGLSVREGGRGGNRIVSPIRVGHCHSSKVKGWAMNE